MVAEARLKSKNLYKVELYLLKIMPMVIALAYLVNTVSSYFGVDIPILASIAGMSLIPHYVELFKSWFGDNVDQKIIESAIIFWFKDVDCKSRNKVVSYFKEY